MEHATRTVTPNGAKASIKHALKKKRPIFLWGAPGIGKSDIIRQITDTFSNSHLIGRDAYLSGEGIIRVLTVCILTFFIFKENETGKI